MSGPEYDLAIIGAGSGGLTAAAFAVKLGARVALIEKNRIGGDCTWTGCVPSKALLRVAKAAHEVRSAARFGIGAGEPTIDMGRVREYIREAIRKVYHFESPDELRKLGIDVVEGGARFTDASTVLVGERAVRAKKFLLTTGARPTIPDVAGLADVPYVTYESVFENDRLPRTMVVMGGGPIGLEIAQAYARLGTSVTVVARQILPKDEPEARESIRRVLEAEGVRFVWGRATKVWREGVWQDGGEIAVGTDAGDARGELLLVATGRKPSAEGLELEKAGVEFSETGIGVDGHLRTSVKHIYAAGDVTGGPQFTHFAGWQAFQAVRNALLPGASEGTNGVVPWVTFTDPEVAHVGLTEEQARAHFGEDVRVGRQDMSRTDRAVCDGEGEGFLKLIIKGDGAIVGATAVHARAGESICELAAAMQRGMKASELAAAIHAYPTYSFAVQQVAAELATDAMLSGLRGRVVRALSEMTR